jgi:hypothetical protein
MALSERLGIRRNCTIDPVGFRIFRPKRCEWLEVLRTHLQTAVNLLPLVPVSSYFLRLGYFRGDVQTSPNCIDQIENHEYILFSIRVVLHGLTYHEICIMIL